MCSTHTQLSNDARRFIKHEDWVAHLECSVCVEEKGKKDNKSGLKPVPAPFLTPSSSALSSGSYSRAQYQSRARSQPWMNHDVHTLTRTNSSTYGRSRDHIPVKISGVSCRYGIVFMSIETLYRRNRHVQEYVTDIYPIYQLFYHLIIHQMSTLLPSRLSNNFTFF